jgi:hypothetical protein
MEEEGERKAAMQQLHKPATANNEQRTPILIALECCCCVERMPFREYALRAGSSRCQGKCTASRFASLSNVPAQPNFCERQTPSHSPAPRYNYIRLPLRLRRRLRPRSTPRIPPVGQALDKCAAALNTAHVACATPARHPPARPPSRTTTLYERGHEIGARTYVGRYGREAPQWTAVPQRQPHRL